MLRLQTKLQAFVFSGAVSCLSPLGCSDQKREPERQTVPSARLPKPSSSNVQRGSANWPEAKKRIFPLDASSEEEKAFSLIEKFCREKKVDLNETVDLAFKMHGVSVREKLDALTITSFILSLQKEGDKGFYRDNKLFIDTILEKIRAGKLKIKDGRKKAAELGGSGNYNSGENAIFFMRDMDPSSPVSQGLVIHELYHLYQDILRERPSMSGAEFQAYLRQGKYLLAAAGLTPESDPKAVEEFVARHFEKLNKGEPTVPAIWVAFHQKAGREAPLSEWTRKLKDAIEVAQLQKRIRWMFPKYVTGPIQERIDRYGSKVLQQDLPEIEQIVKERLKDLRETAARIESEKSDPAVIDEKVFQLIIDMGRLVFIKLSIEAIGSRAAPRVDITDPEGVSKDIFTELAPYHSGDYVPDTSFDGVE